VDVGQQLVRNSTLGSENGAWLCFKDDSVSRKFNRDDQRWVQRWVVKVFCIQAFVDGCWSFTS
jgi:hypothetical protein